MILYLCRHAAAQDATGKNMRDENRPLTPEGIEKFRRVATKASPHWSRGHAHRYCRCCARQTAMILFKVLAKDGKVSGDLIIIDASCCPESWRHSLHDCAPYPRPRALLPWDTSRFFPHGSGSFALPPRRMRDEKRGHRRH